MARRRIKHSDARERALEALREGLSLTAAAARAGICRSTLWKWQTADADFREAVDDAIESGTDKIEDALAGKALAMDDAASVQAAKILLGARRPAKFRERHVHEHTGRLLLTDVMAQLHGGEVIEGELVDMPEDEPPAALPGRAEGKP